MKFSEIEYQSLREELITRLSILNNQTHTAGVTIISTWTVGIALMVGIGSFENLNDVTYVCLQCMDSFLFLIPIMFFIPLAVKSGENLNQIASLSAYIRVFF